jgi:hypothetical protein
MEKGEGGQSGVLEGAGKGGVKVQGGGEVGLNAEVALGRRAGFGGSEVARNRG